ncbi:MAG TPA: sulfatase-like hydrolase/transferase [Gemmata sp.]|jgi:arylsulfatase A-like enzyme/sugar phosphate isomerase/epimerase|nr:sulfatase-like hydrolase/transferase [Gemmata sp.]
MQQTKKYLEFLVLIPLIASPVMAADPPAQPLNPKLYDRDNLVAWCIVPFDAKKRSPAERVEMLKKLGFTKYAYDWRAEHLPTFGEEVRLLKKANIELTAVWFPAGLNADARTLLDAIKKHGVKTQLWITMGEPAGKGQKEKVEAAAKAIRPIAAEAEKLGCSVALYNHGGWFGEPENQIAIIDSLKLKNVGIVYNLHHGHDHLDRFPELLKKMLPHLVALNLNGMAKDGEKLGKKILPLGQGELDLKLLKTIEESGYGGPIGILGHTQDDAEERLRDNLDGLDWLLPQLTGTKAGPKPKYRTMSSEARKHPNILLILVDDLGYGDLGCYGSKDIRTPNIDRLSKEGVRLTDCYSAAAVCSPTRAALITGRYPQRSGFEWVIDYNEKDRGLKATDTSLPRLLKKGGYATGLFGKWHLGYKAEFGPNAHGFDDFFGFPSADLDYYSHKDANGDPGLYSNTKLIQENGYLTDLITDRSTAFLKKNASNPFFLEVAYNAPHWPFQVPGKPDDFRDEKTYGPRTGTRADYIKMVEHLDTCVGKLLAELDRLGLSKETLVIFTNDNGGERLSDNGPLFHGKYTLWEGGIRVPCIVRQPGAIPVGTTSAQPIITMDLTAGILSAAGIAPPAEASLDGEDVLAILAGKKPKQERTFFWRLKRPGEQGGQKAVRRGKWKYILDRRVELLYDLEADLGERKSLAYEHPEIVMQLREALAGWEAKMPPVEKK